MAGVALIFSIQWSHTITLGSLIVAAFVGLAGLATFGYGARWKTNFETERATSESLREGRDAYQLKAERLEGELVACKGHLNQLEATRSLTPVIAAVLDGFQKMEERFSQHEQRAQDRHETDQRQGEQHLKILELIAHRLGPDAEAHRSAAEARPARHLTDPEQPEA